MIKNAILFTLFVVLASGISANTNTSELDKFNSAKSSVSFTENKGQISDQNYNPRPDVLFSGEANGLTFHIRKDGISYQTSRVDSWKQQDENLPEGMREEGKTDSIPDQMTIYRTDINWLGFNKDYTIENGESTAGFNNYYLPSCPDGAMNVKSYTDVTFKNLYDGIDVKWYEKDGQLEYDFIVAPNSDYTKISWEIKGADRISIGENGQLIIETPLGNIEEQAPIAFQGETIVEAAWKIDGNKIGFQLGSYNENEVLIIDPVVRLWGTYYGGSRYEYESSCATDASGNVYLAGRTSSTTGIATTGAHQTTSGGSYDAFLVKFNSSGVRQWGTYYGGTGREIGLSCATDASGNVYLAGYTNSTTGIATTGAHQTTSGGSDDAFLVKFNSSGVRQWGTYYGGTGQDYGLSCATDTSGNIYLAGITRSTSGIATTGAHQTNHGGYRDAFLVKFNSSGVRQWGTYYGGRGYTYGHYCTTDVSGNVYLTGYTPSTTGIATTGAHQTTYSGNQSDAFLVKFNSSGVRQWGTYYGGKGGVVGNSCATDTSGNVYLAGYTGSTTGIATTSAHDTAIGGLNDAFLVKFNSSGVRQWGTYYGGTGSEYGYSCATDASGNVYLSGSTGSTTGIATIGAHLATYGGSVDAFLVKFDPCPAAFSEDTIVACDSYKWIDGVIYTANDTSATDILVTSYGCDSIVSLHLTINYTKTLTDTIVACDSYKWINGVTYTTSNYVASVSFTAANGCDSIVSLHLTISYTKTFTDTIVGCDSYKWINGLTYTASNYTAKDTLVSANGCDSIVSLRLTINSSSNSSSNVTACNAYTWTQNNRTYSSSGVYTDTVTNAVGCDSVIKITITINPTYFTKVSASICDNQTYTTAGSRVVSSTGVYLDTLQSALSCDSVIETTLTVNPTYFTQVSASICDNQTYITAGNRAITLAGVYTDTVQSFLGCDSVVEITIRVNPTYFTKVSATICDNQTYTTAGNQVVSIAGVYLDTLQSALSCDSVIETTLTVNPTYFTQESATICDNQTYTTAGNQVVSIAGVYLDTLQSMLSCDSVIQTTLTVNPTYFSKVEVTICGNESYTTIGGQVISTAGVYTDTLQSVLSCDSVFETTLNEIPVFISTQSKTIESCVPIYSITGKYIDKSGVYIDTLVTIKGCDSVYFTSSVTIAPLDLTIQINAGVLTSNDVNAQYKWLDCNNNYSVIPSANAVSYNPDQVGVFAVEISRLTCLDTSYCYLPLSSVTSVERSSDIKVYPNPTNGKLTIDAENFEDVEVYDTSGRLIIKSSLKTIDLEEQSKGLYLLKINASGTTQEFKVFKE